MTSEGNRRIAMNAKEELKKWKDDFAKAKTEQAKLEHKKRFNTYVNSLSSAGESTTKKILDSIKNIGAELQSATL